MGEKGLRVLEETIKNPLMCQVEYVVCARDKQIKNDYFEDIKSFAFSNNIKFLERGIDPIPDNEVNFYFAISWRWLIKANLEKLIVFHDSLLPRYRGFNPLVTALIEGDTNIGVTAILASESFDKGNIIGRESIQIEYPIKIEFAIDIISKLYGKLFYSIINKMILNELTEDIQDELNATYSLWRDEEDYIIDWSQSSKRIKRFIDAVGYPYNGAKSSIDGVELTILEAEVQEDLKIINNVPGKIFYVVDNKPVIVCGSGLLKLTNVVVRNTNQPYLFNKTRIRLK